MWIQDLPKLQQIRTSAKSPKTFPSPVAKAPPPVVILQNPPVRGGTHDKGRKAIFDSNNSNKKIKTRTRRKLSYWQKAKD
jgi:hypothetical protein